MHSIQPVLNELQEGKDELSEWATNAPDGFFHPVDQATANNLQRVATWVNGHDFRDEGKREFLAKADPIIIAYAIANNCTVVTHEVLNLEQRRRVKIPVVCQHFDVPFMRTFDMLRQSKATFHYVTRP